MMNKRMIGAVGLAIAMQPVIIAQEAPMTPLRPDQVAFLALYKELVETNTTLSAGSCTLAAERIAAMFVLMFAVLSCANWSNAAASFRSTVTLDLLS